MLSNRENDRLDWPVIISLRYLKVYSGTCIALGCNRETKHLFTEDSEVV